ncbi:SUMF1/EgtB/PvdO family nonheme iron enzyme [Agrobacterium larrymoorei]|uniref:SUMF1/EgtB/PvdO family nonheme iron enzyme n=1 Tax=Agrobacterium larrymoorei TaxID=160699 RepID=A0AAF0HFP2_9HYPH|nr:SUMF1/EgtB/PvdO family nonheme iron enzyme [Agrobacterium larrymoorei]WHA43791.1 SUMF1/EgtB/PvdO family nonheme iron enzyme [Agrobacterium larrymoorei]
MKENNTALRDQLYSKAKAFGDEPLLSLPGGKVATLEEGYIPPLVNFSFEDKAAKGLRKLKDQAEPEPAVYFSALEVVRDNATLALIGETGSGKSTFARHLAFSLGKGGIPATDVERNDQGAVHPQEWSVASVLPVYLSVSKALSFAALLAEAAIDTVTMPSDGSILLILDGVEQAGDQATTLLQDAVEFQNAYPQTRILALIEMQAAKRMSLPSAFARHELLPLLKTQRRNAVVRLTGTNPDESDSVLSDGASNPAHFIMALNGGGHETAIEGIVDRWLEKIAGDTGTADFLCGLAYDALAGEMDDPSLFPVVRARQLLAARHLAVKAPEIAVAQFIRDTDLWSPAIKSLAERLRVGSKVNGLIEALIDSGNLSGVLLAARLLNGQTPLRQKVMPRLLEIIEHGLLSASEREVAGRIVSSWGDPRDLEALALVPEGRFTFGSSTHPNSAPPHQVDVDRFKIGLYPVTNRAYAAFVRATNRLWCSPDRDVAERQSAPATDLTWRDAQAYCAWLTDKWRSDGRISADEIIRLPTEPEWERAARGDQADAGEAIVYPWGSSWVEAAANSEEAGFNDSCTVGLFPKGRSPYGCYDMAGQVWEWCSTLWGEDMASPSFQYPYRNDGREDDDAAPSIRRVLRGGCFSSGKLKACCTYRGSLEPDGFWRGNGFRIVVAKIKT